MTPQNFPENTGVYFVPQVLLQSGPKSEQLNSIFGDCLVKYIDVLGRKGCCRTALEFCKLLFGLGPKNDEKGVLLRIDYYAMRAKEYGYLIEFIEKFTQQVYKKSQKIPCVKLMPNFMMSSALALKNMP